MSPLGRHEWFRSVSKVASNPSPNSSSTPLKAPKKPLISQEDIELEYLNEISKLTREKEEARDEVERRVKESESLRTSLLESNESLKTKVSELEAKLREDKDRSKSPVNSSSVQSSDQSDRNFNDLKAKLLTYQASNKALNAKVKKLKQRRQEGDDDVSDVSSIASLSLMSVFSSRSNTSQQMDACTIQNKYAMELTRNSELEQKLRIVEAYKLKAEEQLVELMNQSNDQVERHNSEMKALQNELSKAEDALITLRGLSENHRNKVEKLQSNESIDELEENRQKIHKMEKEIMERSIEISILRTKLQENKAEKEKMDNLKVTMRQLEEEKVVKAEEIERLKLENERNISRLTKLEKTLKLNGAENKDTENDEELLNKEITILIRDIKAKDEEIIAITQDMKKVQKEKYGLQEELESIEQSLVTTKLKNAELMEQIELLQHKQHEEKMNSSAPENRDFRTREMKIKDQFEKKYQSSMNTISDLEKIVKEKEQKLKMMEAKSTHLTEIIKKVEELERELEMKTKEVSTLQNEKHESAQRLQTLEMDFIVTQEKGAKTWQDLEDLKEALEHEKNEKTQLQNKLKRADSIEKMVEDTKKLSATALKDRDNEIEILKTKLTEANIAKGATEKKLLTFMNNSAAQESTRELMKLELEDQLKEENERVQELITLIKEKEDDIEKIRHEFGNLAKTMQSEMEMKRTQITELNGEILEKSNLLNEKDRDLLLVKSAIDDIELLYSTEISRLKKELSASVDKKELETLRSHNSELEYSITSLNAEIGKLRAIIINQPKDIVESNISTQILRNRNEKLKQDVEKLTSKLKRENHHKNKKYNLEKSDRKSIRKSDREKSLRKDTNRIRQRESRKHSHLERKREEI